MTTYWISLRKVSGNEFTNDLDLGAPRYLALPEGRLPVPTDAISTSQWVKNIFSEFTRDPKSGDIRGNVLFFVHGYNNSIQNVLDAHNKIAAGLAANNFTCTVISFDWPSADVTVAYLEDLDTAKQCAIQIVNKAIKVLLKAQTTNCTVAVHALAHSMGAYLIREALDHADDGQSTSTNWTLNQLVVIAGDVAEADFSAGNRETESMYAHSYRLTNFFNRYDEVLQISNVKRAGVAPRVGRVGLPSDAPSKAVNLDCSDHFLKTYGEHAGGDIGKTHSWYFADEKFLQDLSITLHGVIDRLKIPTRIVDSDGVQHLAP